MNLLLKAVLLMSLFAPVAGTTADTNPSADGVHWYSGTVSQAFDEARNSNKPIFLYWGAVWCPPCNQLKATLFKNPAFIRKTRLFVPVYLDGDTEAAQKLGEQFGVLGYPTLILFSPDGKEITRLPGGMSLELYPQMLDLALAKVKPVATLVQEVLDGGRKPTADELHMLAYYSWQQDAGKALGERPLAQVLKSLADRVPADMPAEKMRLDAQYLAVLASREQPPTDDEKKDAVRRLRRILSSADACRDNFSFIVYDLETLIPRISLAHGNEQKQLLHSWGQVLQQLQKDELLSPAQKLLVYTGKIHWMKVAEKPVPENLKDEIRQAVIAARKQLTDGHERIAVNYAAYGALKASGQVALAERLIAEEMQAGSNNQYWMLVLADLAAESGNEDEALNWYAKAWETAEGEATRLQWGSYYIRQLTQQTPDDDVKIMAVSEELFSRLAKQKTPFHGRSKRALERIFKALNAWGELSSPAELIKLKSAFIKSCLPFGDQALSRCEAIMKVT